MNSESPWCLLCRVVHRTAHHGTPSAARNRLKAAGWRAGRHGLRIVRANTARPPSCHTMPSHTHKYLALERKSEARTGFVECSIVLEQNTTHRNKQWMHSLSQVSVTCMLSKVTILAQTVCNRNLMWPERKFKLWWWWDQQVNHHPPQQG